MIRSNIAGKTPPFSPIRPAPAIAKSDGRGHIGRMNQRVIGTANQTATMPDGVSGALMRRPWNVISRMPARRPPAYTFTDHALMVRFATPPVRRYRDQAPVRTDG
ncbi:hypothetical protein SSBR45G_25800 [Bradyrhizobium sp. SSBR45G]|nr:hypothetical protein SSBR45G_25800 [Bradyrhizobium sp. SSBR45G]GLH84909.1 hypothetical protein SSBR45R_23690 [Bradyrhizobium sp. SSBR45R]